MVNLETGSKEGSRLNEGQRFTLVFTGFTAPPRETSQSLNCSLCQPQRGLLATRAAPVPGQVTGQSVQCGFPADMTARSVRYSTFPPPPRSPAHPARSCRPILLSLLCCLLLVLLLLLAARPRPGPTPARPTRRMAGILSYELGHLVWDPTAPSKSEPARPTESKQEKQQTRPGQS